ncbi:MAG: hypothetical protein H7Y86_10905 [Rhizobacter sp.]|nr:hypothetical protein [Ferruginibacter sp.]
MMPILNFGRRKKITDETDNTDVVLISACRQAGVFIRPISVISVPNINPKG